MNELIIKNTYTGNTELYSADNILCTAIDIGANILKNGGEIARVEETIERICTAYGAQHVEAFAITTMITASVRMADGSYSQQLRHVKTSKMNLYRVEQLNLISRKICNGEMGIEEAKKATADVKKKEPYPSFLSHIGVCLFVMGFTVFFDGSWFDALAAGAIGLIMSLLSSLDTPLNQGMMNIFFNSFLSGVLSIVFVRIGFGKSLDAILIGTIMFLIPGFALGFSIKDMVTGNLLSGLMRFLQSLLAAVMIALGYAAALLILGGLI